MMGELAHNLESFNSAFTAVLLAVQRTIGASDYVARDMALKNLIQPLAGEYGMHNGQAQGGVPTFLDTEPTWQLSMPHHPANTCPLLCAAAGCKVTLNLV